MEPGERGIPFWEKSCRGLGGLTRVMEAREGKGRERKGKGRRESKGEKRKQLLDVKAMTRAPAVTEKSNLSAIRRISGGRAGLAAGQ